MKRFVITLASILILAPFFAAAQPVRGLKPSRTVLLYADSFEGNIDPVYGKEIVCAGFEMSESNELSGPETIDERGILKNVSDLARVDLYFPKKPNGQMIVVCPGGGYVKVSTYGEGQYVADWLLSKGITVAVLKYRIPNGHWNIPLEDVHNTFRYCRENAEKWKVDQIGVIGFSAGGHLAACASNLYTDAVTRPDFSILTYPVISFDYKVYRSGTRPSLIGADRGHRSQIAKLFGHLPHQVAGHQHIPMCPRPEGVRGDEAIPKPRHQHRLPLGQHGKKDPQFLGNDSHGFGKRSVLPPLHAVQPEGHIPPFSLPQGL